MLKLKLILVAALLVLFAVPTFAQVEGVGAIRKTSKAHAILFSLSLATAEADAASTVKAEHVYGSRFGEDDPIARPFLDAPRPVYYGSEAAMAFALEKVGERMEHSRHRFIRHVWFVPQVAQIALSAWCAGSNSKGVADR